MNDYNNPTARREALESLRQKEYDYLKQRLRHLQDQSEIDGDDTINRGYRVRIYGATDWEDTSRPGEAVLNWSATGDQSPATAKAFAKALERIAAEAESYNLERARIICNLNEREREIDRAEAEAQEA